MLIDFREIDDGVSIEADCCIIGGGPAGITLARDLAAADIDVCLAESGGLEFDQATQDLYQGSVNSPAGLVALHKHRLRYLGGSSGHWGGLCQPLDPIDFEVRPWISLSGWPFSRDHLVPFYRRAQKVCRAWDFAYDEQSWRNAENNRPVLDSDRLEYRFWQQTGRLRFGNFYRDDLARETNPRVFLHANAIEIVPESSQHSIAEVRLRALDGREARIRADHFVVACGALESARLLLASPGLDGRGIGNDYDRVGRCFMAHARFLIDGFALTQPAHAYQFLLEQKFGEARVLAGFGPSAAAQHRHRLVNGSVRFAPSFSDAYRAFNRLDREIDRQGWPRHLLDDLMTMTADLDDSLMDLYARLIDGDEPVRAFSLLVLMDDPPVPENRARLSPELDALGLPKLVVDWRPPDEVKISLRKVVGLIAQEMTHLGLGTVVVPDWLDRDDNSWLAMCTGGVGHQMGTLRMSDDPRTGVTDANGKIHGINNLYAAGASTFPTGGCANPTLTLVALTLRLADHLKSKLK